MVFATFSLKIRKGAEKSAPFRMIPYELHLGLFLSRERQNKTAALPHFAL